jgi:hypothetical protein
VDLLKTFGCHDLFIFGGKFLSILEKAVYLKPACLFFSGIVTAVPPGFAEPCCSLSVVALLEEGAGDKKPGPV